MGFWDSISGWFGGDSSGGWDVYDSSSNAADLASIASDSYNNTADKGSGFSWGSILTNPNVLSTGLTGLVSLYSNSQEQKAQEEQLAMQQQQDQFKLLTELAKLKYLGTGKGGGGGGGGGVKRNRNADLIEVIAAGTDDKLKALDDFARNYVSAVK